MLVCVRRRVMRRSLPVCYRQMNVRSSCCARRGERASVQRLVDRSCGTVCVCFLKEPPLHACGRSIIVQGRAPVLQNHMACHFRRDRMDVFNTEKRRDDSRMRVPWFADRRIACAARARAKHVSLERAGRPSIVMMLSRIWLNFLVASTSQGRLASSSSSAPRIDVVGLMNLKWLNIQ